jgi:hypothetical protein
MATNFSSYQYKQAPKATLEACDQIGVVRNLLKSDDEATFNSKIVCLTSMSGSDVAFNLEADQRARAVVNGKNGVDPLVEVADTDDIALFFRNSTAARVEFVQDIVDKNIANEDGDTLNIPQSIHFINEPTPVA